MIRFIGSRLNAVNRKETLRYLGYRKNVADTGAVEGVLDECEQLVLSVQDLKAVYDIFDISWGQSLDLGFARVNSRALELNLQGCNRIVLFAATAGAGIDRLIAKYNRLSPAKAVVIQAMGAALVEEWCDTLHDGFIRDYGANKSRFSCGFGDLPLTLQRDIFVALNVTKNLGVTLSDDCFMTPTKSVTAIIGIRQ